MREPTASFSHEEIIFLFARVFQGLGFDTIKKIQTQYPDCVATKATEDKRIEFEPLLSSFGTHLADDLSMCDYVICWADDLPPNHHLKSVLRENGIDVIKLREIYEKTRPDDRPQRAFYYSRDDIRRFTLRQLSMLRPFVTTGEEFLTKEQLMEHTGIKGRALGGSLRAFTEKAKRKDWLLRQTAKGCFCQPKTYPFDDRKGTHFSCLA